MRYFSVKLFVFFSLCLMVACGSGGDNSEVQKTDKCTVNPKHTYQVYIPAHRGSNEDLPILVAVDSHGSGKMSVQHLKKAVTDYPAILIASNLIKNNDPNYISELDDLIKDVKAKYNPSEEVYLTGFSGGARMVLNYATRHQVAGVIACGAFADAKQIEAIKCPVYGLVGMDDFNFMETAPMVVYPDKAPENAHIELIYASHEWPAQESLASVFAWFRLQNVKGKIEKQQLADYVSVQSETIKTLQSEKDALRAVAVARNMASVPQYDEMGAFSDKEAEILQSNVYKVQLQSLVNALKFEISQRAVYAQALLEKDTDWWKNELDTLNYNIENEPQPMMQMSYKRLKGLVGILCYSYSSRFAQNKDAEKLEKVLAVYLMAEPDNEDAKRFQVILDQLKK